MRSFWRFSLGLYAYVVFYLALLWFGLLSLLFSACSIILQPVLPEATARKVGRVGIMTGFRFFLGCLKVSGCFRFDLSELDSLRGETSLIIAPNHPSLWDAVLIVSRLPNVACIMKAEVISNLFVGAGARLAAYIRNASTRQMINLSVEDLERGSLVLLFPEGTRTVQKPVNPFKGSIGVIANRAQAPIQTVFIETDSPFLTKGWPVYKMPPLPMRYRVRLGRRFEPPAQSAALVSELQEYFMHEMSGVPAPSTLAAQVESSIEPTQPTTHAAVLREAAEATID